MDSIVLTNIAYCRDLPVEELFYGHELTFLLSHAFGYNDELIFQPTGRFARKSQSQGGTWELDGDLLHLKWRQPHKSTEETDTEEDYTLDVLVAEDASMHYFSSDPMTDKMYARDTPEHLTSKRPHDPSKKTRISLVKATVADVPRTTDGQILRNTIDAKSTVQRTPSVVELESLTQEDLAFYVLSPAELIQHGYPIDVGLEQAALLADTNGGSRDAFQKTQPRISSTTDKLRVCALDCEMCETDLGMELTRVTVVDISGQVIYDQLVKPQNTIINYHTEFSGITATSLQSIRHILQDVQKELMDKYLFEDTVLVGHSLTSDLRALRLVHLNIADTAILYPHQRGFPFKTSLKYLSKSFLNKDIQTKGNEGHDSAEDAIAALELFLDKVRHGPLYGIPNTTIASSAYTTLLEKLKKKEKKMTMLSYTSENNHSDAKPWHLYASGELQSQLHSPYTHAKAVLTQQEDVELEEGSTRCLSNVVDCKDSIMFRNNVKEAVSREDDLLWIELEQCSSHDTTKEFLLHHSQWMETQLKYCTELDALLSTLHHDLLSKDTMLMMVPQGDLSMVRYLKGLRTRSKWKDVPNGETSTEEIHAAVSDAVKSVMDSCVFLIQK